MDDTRRTALAILISLMVMMVYTQLAVTPPPPLSPSSTVTSLPVPQPTLGSPAPTLTGGGIPPVAGTTSSLPSAVELEASPVTHVVTDRSELEIVHLGGRLKRYRVSEYRRDVQDDDRLDLVTASPGGAFPLGIHVGTMHDAAVKYELTSTSRAERGPHGEIMVPAGEELRLEFTGTFPTGATIKKIVRVLPHPFLMEVEAQLSSPPADGSPIGMEWVSFVSPEEEASSYNPKQFTLLSAQAKLRELAINTLTPGTVNDLGHNSWVSFGNKYFMGALVPQSPSTVFRVGNDSRTYFVRAYAPANEAKFTIYAGPKAFEVLRPLGLQLERSINLGFFAFLADPLLRLLRFFYWIFGNYGLAIILLTLLIKLAFYPLTKASFKSMSAMQELQPEMKELRERIKDPQQLNQEMMALYKRRGVNPLGGCLPILIQIPVFFGLYNALLQSIELRHAPFALWIDDLSSPERLYLLGLPVPLMILLMGASMLLQQWTQPSSMDPQQQKIMMLTPVIFTVMFIIFPMPAGLVLYWLVNNVISIIQQVYLRKTKGAHPLTATLIASVSIFSFGFVLTLL